MTEAAGKLSFAPLAAVPPPGPDREPIPELLTVNLIQRYYLRQSSRTIWRMIATCRFPKPEMSFGEKQRFWRRSTIETWIAAEIARQATAQPVEIQG